MRPRPYIGITGFESGAQVGAVRAALPPDRLLMVGCGMRGHPTSWAPDKWPNRCPRPERLPEIFLPYKNVLNILHFTPLEECDLFEHMCLAREVAGPFFHGFQLNTPWPSFNDLTRYKTRYPQSVITIALQPDALEVVESNSVRIARTLTMYDRVADYVILDTSAGEGKDIDTSFTRRTYEEIERLLPHLGLVAAGGLHAGNAEEQLGDLLRQFALSTDAESKLRNFPSDLLDTGKVIRYVQKTDKLLRKYETQRNLEPVS